MFGFGTGNNIEPWLDFFKDRTENYSLTFICNKFTFSRDIYHNIKIIELDKRIISKIYLIIFLIKNRFDILYIHGMYDFILRIILLMFSKSTIKCLNIWNNKNYKKASTENRNKLKRALYHLVLKKSDTIYFTWYGTKLEFEEILPEFKPKTRLNPWGLRNTVLDLDRNIEAQEEFTIQYLKNLKSDEFFLFWPETMSEHEHVHTFLQALYLIKDKYPLRVLLFCGTQSKEDSYIQYLKSLIQELQLKFVDLKVGQYLSFTDIMSIWERSNLAIKLSTKDQLSSGILESLYFRNPMILNDWLPYKKLEDLGLKIYLTQLSSESIAENLSVILNELQKDKHYFDLSGDQNRKIIKQNFNFEENIQKIFSTLNKDLSI